MNRLSLAIAASLLTLAALTPRPTAARESIPTTRPDSMARGRSIPTESGPWTLAQNDQMNMQQGTPGNGGNSADTGDQSPPDDQSVDTETGQEVQPQGPSPESGMDAGDLGETNQNVGDSGDTPQNNRSDSGASPHSSDSGY